MILKFLMSNIRMLRIFWIKKSVKLNTTATKFGNICLTNNEDWTSVVRRTVYKMAATSVVVLDRGNNTTCTINLHGKYFYQSIIFLLTPGGATLYDYLKQLILATKKLICHDYSKAVSFQVFKVLIVCDSLLSTLPVFLCNAEMMYWF